VTRRPLSASDEMRTIFPSRMPTLRTASRPVSGSMTRPPSSTRSYCCADTMGIDNTRKNRKKISLRMDAPFDGRSYQEELLLQPASDCGDCGRITATRKLSARVLGSYQQTRSCLPMQFHLPDKFALPGTGKS